MKECSGCHEALADSSFAKKGDGLQPYCRKCQKDRAAKWYRENRTSRMAQVAARRKALYHEHQAKLNEIKSQSCMDCKRKYHPCQMDFDHLKEKTADVAYLVGQGVSWERVLEEIAKCDLVCSNCHRLRTFLRRRKAEEVDRSRRRGKLVVSGLAEKLCSRL